MGIDTSAIRDYISAILQYMETQNLEFVVDLFDIAGLGEQCNERDNIETFQKYNVIRNGYFKKNHCDNDFFHHGRIVNYNFLILLLLAVDIQMYCVSCF